MRLKEPFHGLVFVGGQFVFHVSLLAGNLIVVGLPAMTDQNAWFVALAYWFRGAHLVNILYTLVDWCLSEPRHFAKYMFTRKLLETMSMFTYLVVAMYALWAMGGKAG